MSWIDARISNKDVDCPDAAASYPGRLPQRPERLTVPSDLVVGVLPWARGGFELVNKRDASERFGVEEFSVFDPGTTQVRCWRHRAGHLVESQLRRRIIRIGGDAGLPTPLALRRRALR